MCAFYESTHLEKLTLPGRRSQRGHLWSIPCKSGELWPPVLSHSFTCEGPCCDIYVIEQRHNLLAPHPLDVKNMTLCPRGGPREVRGAGI